MWTRIGVCPVFHFGERMWHAGLSEDGLFCFIATVDDEAYVVWDVRRSGVVWKEDGTVGVVQEHPDLDEWVDKDGYVNLAEGPARGRYRVFGLHVNHAKTEDQRSDLVLRVEAEQEAVIVARRSSGEVLKELKYECFSGDWAFASFSDDGRVIAVIEPYYVTFFAERGGDE